MLVFQIAVGILVGWALVQGVQKACANKDGITKRLYDRIGRAAAKGSEINRRFVDTWNENECNRPLPPIKVLDKVEDKKQLTETESMIIAISVVLFAVCIVILFIKSGS